MCHEEREEVFALLAELGGRPDRHRERADDPDPAAPGAAAPLLTMAGGGSLRSGGRSPVDREIDSRLSGDARRCPARRGGHHRSPLGPGRRMRRTSFVSAARIEGRTVDLEARAPPGRRHARPPKRPADRDRRGRGSKRADRMTPRPDHDGDDRRTLDLGRRDPGDRRRADELRPRSRRSRSPSSPAWPIPNVPGGDPGRPALPSFARSASSRRCSRRSPAGRRDDGPCQPAAASSSSRCLNGCHAPRSRSTGRRPARPVAT